MGITVLLKAIVAKLGISKILNLFGILMKFFTDRRAQNIAVEKEKAFNKSKFRNEKLQLKKAQQKELLDEARKLITSSKGEIGEKFLNSFIYAKLKPHLSAKVVKDIEAPRTWYVPPDNGTFVKKTMVLDDIARLEKLWKL